jgi:hypothetical protein
MMADELAREINEMGQAAGDFAITIVPGTFNEEEFPVVQWDACSTSTLKMYIEMAKNLGCPFIVLEKHIFDEATLEDLGPERPEEEDIEEIDGDGEADRAGEFEVTWNKIANEYARYYGSLYAFSLYYFSGGICHQWESEASWYVELTKVASELKAELELAQAELKEEVIPELTEKEIEELASELANYELFQKATNQNTKRFALKKKFPKLVVDHYRQVNAIIDQAKGIFELEIKPAMENDLDNQIAELSKQGLNKDQIAKQLKVSTARVKKAF